MPEFTDKFRARLLRELRLAGEVDQASLVQANGRLQTPFHCAAATGSIEMLSELRVQLETGARYDEEKLSLQDCGVVLEQEDASGCTPLLLALKGGHLVCAYAITGAELGWPGLPRLPEHKRVLQECLGGALGSLRPMLVAPWPQRAAEAFHAFVHEGEAEVLSHLQRQHHELARRTGGLLQREAVEALLNFHGFSVEGAARAFSQDPRAALDAAGLSSVAVSQVRWGTEDVTINLAGARRCMVCFEDVPAAAACSLLACQHVTCDDCLRMYLQVRLGEGNVAGVICPEPSCRLPLSMELAARLFPGGESTQLARMKTLQAQKFVDTAKLSAWCPKPGCGRALSLASSEIMSGGAGATVACSCGQRFCFQCKQLGGHEPVGCEHWKAWQADLKENEKSMKDESERWIKENSKDCTCGAQIQRTGGCNHMICTVCGRHFCYDCGQDWGPHKQQAGGFDFFNCRLPTSGAQLKVEAAPGVLLLACMSGWVANDRDPARHSAMLRSLHHLAAVFEVDVRNSGSPSYSEVAEEAAEACLQARQTLQRCYVLRYNWTYQDWQRRLDRWVGELEAATGALENALGLTQIEAAVNTSDLPSGAKLPEKPTELLRRLDLRQILPRVVAAADLCPAIQQLTTAVVLQRERILAAGRAGFPGVLEAAFDTVRGAMISRLGGQDVSVAGLASRAGCSVM